MRLRQRIRHALVWCAVDPMKVVETNYISGIGRPSDTIIANLKSIVPCRRCFTAVGDTAEIGTPISAGCNYAWTRNTVTINVTDSTILNPFKFDLHSNIVEYLSH